MGGVSACGHPRLLSQTPVVRFFLSSPVSPAQPFILFALLLPCTAWITPSTSKPESSGVTGAPLCQSSHDFDVGFLFKEATPFLPPSDSLIASSPPNAAPLADAAEGGLEGGGELMRAWGGGGSGGEEGGDGGGDGVFLETCQLPHLDPSGCLSFPSQVRSCPVQQHAQSSQITPCRPFCGSYWSKKNMEVWIHNSMRAWNISDL